MKASDPRYEELMYQQTLLMCLENSSIGFGTVDHIDLEEESISEYELECRKEAISKLPDVEKNVKRQEIKDEIEKLLRE